MPRQRLGLILSHKFLWPPDFLFFDKNYFDSFRSHRCFGATGGADLPSRRETGRSCCRGVVLLGMSMVSEDKIVLWLKVQRRVSVKRPRLRT